MLPESDLHVQRALEIAVNCCGVEGDDHRAWVIDQMVRALTGCPMVTHEARDCHGRTYQYEALGESEEYLRLVADAKDGVDGPDTYTWNVGRPS